MEGEIFYVKTNFIVRDELIFELKIRVKDTLGVVLVLRNRLSKAVAKDVPLRKQIYDEYDDQSEFQIISESLENIRALLRNTFNQEKLLNKIFHLNNRVRYLQSYSIKFPNLEFFSKVDEQLKEII